MKKKLLLLLFGLVWLLSACSGGNSQAQAELDYEETKKMLVDILHTAEGKKAIQEIMTDDKLKQQMVMDQQAINETIQKTLVSKEGTDFWRQSLKDPKIAAALAKGMQTENQKLLKGLMKDPEYQAMLVQVFKDPELQKEVSDTLKSKEYRTYLQTVIAEAMQSPLFKAEMQDLLLKAAEDAAKGKAAQTSGKGK